MRHAACGKPGLAARPVAGSCVGYLYIDEDGLRYEAFPGGWADMSLPGDAGAGFSGDYGDLDDDSVDGSQASY